MINIKDKCTECDHHEVCKQTKDYIEFGNRISEYSNNLNGEIIVEGVAQLELTCKYFKPITFTITPKSSFDLR